MQGEFLNQNIGLKINLKQQQKIILKQLCHLVLQHYIWNPAAYNIEALKNGKSQSGLELPKLGQTQNIKKEFNEKWRYS